MTAFQLCGLEQVACLSAKATGRRSENILLLVILLIGLGIIVGSIYAYNKFLASKNLNRNLDSPPMWS